ncbi:MAG: SRPBCC domain-containing protein [Chitinivibrionales bacterium]|nr:SRPBCC domain-containing protein [Chitinivibrionales bacterium]
MPTVYAGTDIAAPPRRVWDILSDLPHYAEWNPYMRDARGELRKGRRLRVKLEPVPGSGTLTVHPRLVRVEPGREIVWRGGFLVPGVFSGVHTFRIEPSTPELTRFVQEEQFSGILVPLLWEKIAHDTEHGFKAMNEALKARAEEA